MERWKLSNSFPLRIFILALVLRLVPVLAMRNMGIGLDDMFQYDMLARSIESGNGYRWYAEADLPLIQFIVKIDPADARYDPRGVQTSFRPPFYPLFLASIYFLGGAGAHRFLIVRLVQAVLAASLAPLTFALAKRLSPDRPRVAVTAAWIIAFYPTLIFYPMALATENLFFVLVLSSLLVLLIASERKTWKWFVLGGFLLGLTALTRSVSLAFAGLAVLWIWNVLRKRMMAIVVFTTVSLVTLPWMIRNSLLHNHLTGIESALGYDLYIGYHPAGTGTFQYPQSLDLLPVMDDGLRDAIGQQNALEFIQADPGRFPYLVARKAGYFFGLERRALTYFYSNNYFGHIPAAVLLAIASLFCLPFVIISISGTFGLFVSRWSRETILIVLFLIGYITPHLLILAEDRFHLAIVPFLAIFAASFWTTSPAAIKVLCRNRPGIIRLLLSSVIVVSLLCSWGLELWRDTGKLALLLGPNGNLTSFPY
jgi:hypothetical protein